MTTTHELLESCGVDVFYHDAAADISIVQGDCLEILPELPVGCVELVMADPPYGIGEARKNNQSRSKLASSRDYMIEQWDDRPLPPQWIQELSRVSKWQAIFGGNYYDLPPASCWLVWDKENGANDFADCELAWTNFPKAVRRIRWMWHGMIRKGNEPRVHRTQKPVGVIEWAIQHAPSSELILDTCAGSCTTAVAAKRLGRRCICIELEPKYCEIGKNRLMNEPMPMFVEKSEDTETQQNLFDGAT